MDGSGRNGYGMEYDGGLRGFVMCKSHLVLTMAHYRYRAFNEKEHPSDLAACDRILKTV